MDLIQLPPANAACFAAEGTAPANAPAAVCQFVLKSGKRKNQICGKKVSPQNPLRCIVHHRMDSGIKRKRKPKTVPAEGNAELATQPPIRDNIIEEPQISEDDNEILKNMPKMPEADEEDMEIIKPENDEEETDEINKIVEMNKESDEEEDDADASEEVELSPEEEAKLAKKQKVNAEFLSRTMVGTLYYTGLGVELITGLVSRPLIGFSPMEGFGKRMTQPMVFSSFKELVDEYGGIEACLDELTPLNKFLIAIGYVSITTVGDNIIKYARAEEKPILATQAAAVDLNKLVDQELDKSQIQ